MPVSADGPNFKTHREIDDQLERISHSLAKSRQSFEDLADKASRKGTNSPEKSFDGRVRSLVAAAKNPSTPLPPPTDNKSSISRDPIYLKVE